MKIGLLTLPNACNYGGVLQALAMRHVYESMGHEVIMFNYVFDRRNIRLLGPISFKWYKRFWMRFPFHLLLGLSELGVVKRHLKTLKFVHKYLKPVGVSFISWGQTGKVFDIDVISVGSDQVWNPVVVDPSAFLLKDCPYTDVPAIAYAPSLGQPTIPIENLEDYIEGFQRFKFIGVRELEMKRLLAQFGVESQHVVDPTLLVGKEYWSRFVKRTYKHRRNLVCYFLSEDLKIILNTLKNFSRKMNCDVTVIGEDLVGMPEQLFEGLGCRVKIKRGVGPLEFVSMIANADWVIANSFHALMFSIVFNRQIRIVEPTNNGRKKMRARMQEFVDGGLIMGPLISPSINDALETIIHGNNIEYNIDSIRNRVAESRAWLARSLRRLT